MSLLTGADDVDARIGKLGDVALLEKNLKSNCREEFEKNITVFWALVCYS